MAKKKKKSVYANFAAAKEEVIEEPKWYEPEVLVEDDVEEEKEVELDSLLETDESMRLENHLDIIFY